MERRIGYARKKYGISDLRWGKDGGGGAGSGEKGEKKMPKKRRHFSSVEIRGGKKEKKSNSK